MKSLSLKAGILALGIAIFPSFLWGQMVVDPQKLPSQRSGFFIDLAPFYTPETGKTRLEIYYKIHNSQLTFVKRGEEYVAAYELRALAFKKGKQVAGNSREENYPVKDYAQTTSPTDFIINQIVLEVEPGKYEIQVTLVDKESQRGQSLTLPALVPDFTGAELALSGLEFTQDSRPSEQASQFSKGSLQVIPKVDLFFPPEEESAQFYLEFYAQKPQELKLEYLTRNQVGRVLHKKEEKISVAQGIEPLVRYANLANLAPGKFTLEIIARSLNLGATARTSKEFEVSWSVTHYLKNDFNKAIDLLRYIANGEEIKALKKTKPEEREKSWREFWKSKDPTPETPENEVEAEYFRRLRYANQNFTTWSREGWKTDWGMVYIKYGEPDQVDRHPFDLDSRPYEVWYYFQPPRRVFTFVDDGNGEYHLQYPYDGDIHHLR